MTDREIILKLIDILELSIEGLKAQDQDRYTMGKIEGLWNILDWLRTYATPPKP